MSVRPEINAKATFERESYYDALISGIEETFTYVPDKDKSESANIKDKKKFDSDIYRMKRVEMEILIRYVQEDLSKGMSPPIEYTQLLTGLLCNYFNDIYEKGKASAPALLSKHLYLSGDRTGINFTQYKTIALFFAKGFSESKGQVKDEHKPAVSIIERYRKKQIPILDAFYEEGQQIALSGENYLQKCDLTELIASYLFKSESTADKFYYEYGIEASIKEHFSPQKD